MNRTDIALLSVRLAGLYLLVSTLIGVSDLTVLSIAWTDNGGSWKEILTFLASLMLRAVGGFILFVAAPKLARVVADADDPSRLADHAAVGIIALRLAAVVLWDAALSLIPSLGVPAFRDQDPAYWVTPLAAMLVLTAVGAWLFVSASTIGTRLFGSPDRRATATIDPRVAALAFAAAGLVILVINLPGLSMQLVSFIHGALNDWPAYSSGWKDLLAGGLRVAFGAWLFVGSGGVVSVWQKLSTAGLRQRNDTA